MASTIPHAGYERSTGERRTIGGAILFVVLLALGLLAVTYPALAAATALGGVGGLLAGALRNRNRA